MLPALAGSAQLLSAKSSCLLVRKHLHPPLRNTGQDSVLPACKALGHAARSSGRGELLEVRRPKAPPPQLLQQVESKAVISTAASSSDSADDDQSRHSSHSRASSSNRDSSAALPAAKSSYYRTSESRAQERRRMELIGREHFNKYAFDTALRNGEAVRCVELLQELMTLLNQPPADSSTSASPATAQAPTQLVAPDQASLPAAQQAALPQAAAEQRSSANGVHASNVSRATKAALAASKKRPAKRSQDVPLPRIEPMRYSPASREFVGSILKGRHQWLIRQLTTEGRLDMALQFVMMVQSGPRLFGSLIKICLDNQDLPGLQQVLQVRSDMGTPNDEFAYSSLITLTSKLGQHEASRRFYEQAWQEGFRHTYVCNAAIEACGRRGDTQGAMHILEQMDKEEVEADTITFNASLRSVAKGQQQPGKVQELYRRLCSSRLVPDAYTYTALFDAAFHSKLNDGTWLLEVFYDMETFDVACNRVIMCAFLNAISQAALSGQQMEDVIQLVSSYQQAGPPEGAVYAALLTFCVRQGMPERAVAIWEAAQEDGLAADGYLYSALFAACAAGDTPELLGLASRAQEQMHKDWNGLRATGKVDKVAERSMRVAHNSLLHFFAVGGRAEEAMRLYQSMQANGPSPDVITMNTLIATYAQIGEHKRAFEVVKDMRRRKMAPEGRTYCALLNACAKAGDIAQAEKVFKLMGQAGITPSVPAYTSLIDACVKHGTPDSLDRAFQVFEEMLASGASPTAVTYGCMLVACQRRKDVEKAFRLYQEACARGVLPTDECHNVLINVCTEAGRVDEALELVKELARKHGNMQQHTLNSVVRALAVKHVERALRMLSLMRTLGQRPSYTTYMSLITATARASRSVEAHRLYWELRSQGAEASSEAGSELIICLCQANQSGQALRVYEDMMGGAIAQTAEADLPPSRLSRADVRPRKQRKSVTMGSGAAGSGEQFEHSAAGVVASEGERLNQQVAAVPKHAGTAVGIKSVRAQQRHDEASCAHEEPSVAPVDAATTTTPSHQAAKSPDHVPPQTGVASAAAATLVEEGHSHRSSADSSRTAVSEQDNNQPAAVSLTVAMHSSAASGSVAKVVGEGHNSSRQGFTAARNPIPPATLLAKPISSRPVGNGLGSSPKNAPSDVGASAGRGGHSSGPGSATRSLSKRATLPRAAALGALLQSRAAAGDLDKAMQLYRQMKRDARGTAQLTLSARPMWDALIESCLANGRTELALKVFDDWKAAAAAATTMQAQQPGIVVKFPKLSYVTLAYLESRCRAEPAYEWRVYDVCASMRQQKERKDDAALPRPKKASHHFLE